MPENTVATLCRPPLRRLSRVAHIGTLDPADKGEFSHEAHGLSVSLHPEEWERIAKLGGNPWHLLERDGGVFLDYWALGRRAKRAITRWGIEHGLVTRRHVHARSWWDDEAEDTMRSLHATRAEAVEEGELEEQPAVISRILTYTGTAKLKQRTGARTSQLNAFDELVVCYVEDAHPDIDGVWWEDEHAWMSAPRGCIVPARLDRWSRQPLDRHDAEHLLGE
jgi:hypothetical protein